MLFDAFQLLRGAATPPETLGMWTHVVKGVGLDPARFGPVFLVMAIAWIVATVAVLRGHPGAQKPAAIVAFATLWYLVMGTGLAIIYLIALATMRNPAESA